MPDGTTDFSLDPELASTKAATAKRTTDPAARFPYTGLEEAVLIARAVFEHGASALSLDQLAVAIKLTPDNGTFQLKLASARMFGLVESFDGKVRLTELGERICSGDALEAMMARRDAFLNVPLYSKTYTEFRGRQLPPSPSGIEERFVSFGVTPKQKDKARRAFENSAHFAGFFAGGRDRLIDPVIATSVPGIKLAQEPKDEGSLDDAATLAHSRCADWTKEPLIQGMLIRLPTPGSEWALEKRAQWLQVLACNMEMIYSTPASVDGKMASIEVKLEISKIP